MLLRHKTDTECCEVRKFDSYFALFGWILHRNLHHWARILVAFSHLQHAEYVDVGNSKNLKYKPAWKKTQLTPGMLNLQADCALDPDRRPGWRQKEDQLSCWLNSGSSGSPGGREIRIWQLTDAVKGPIIFPLSDLYVASLSPLETHDIWWWWESSPEKEHV